MYTNSSIGFEIWSAGGELGFESSTYVSALWHVNEWRWDIGDWEVNGDTDFFSFFLVEGYLGFAFYYEPPEMGLAVPHWFCVLTTVALAVAPWFRWSKRFSLRTLLIATTLVAVALGMVMAF